MATLDRGSDTLVVRIVYDGPPTAGKTTSLRALAERLGQGQVFTPEESGGRTVYFDWMEYTGGRFDGRQIRCQIVSVPGQRVLAPRRNRLLEQADAVVFVADTSRTGINESTAHLEELLGRLGAQPGAPIGVVLQANKRDLPDVVPLEQLRRAHKLAVIESIASAGEGIREAFVFAVRLALDRVREQMRLGDLPPLPADANSSALFEEMKAMPLDPSAYSLWPTEALVAPSAPGSAPRLPDTSIPGGWIWQPINGRILLQEACASSSTVPREVTPHEWVAESADGWRFHSSASGSFPESESAREALIRWAQLHATLSGWLSPNRCIALCATGTGGYRLWQVVRTEASMWKRLTETLSTRNAERISAHFSEAATLCTRAAARWAQAPYALPCTLETVGSVDGLACFVSLMPEADRLSPPEPTDHRAKLWHQLHTLVNAEFGELHFISDLTRPEAEPTTAARAKAP